ncbi:MAG: WhiB family transcriptional regulator [Acidimicrobiales bacterium]|nr:WhiB family transcriptional regulator [Acidimicrobiales bacterium]MDG2217354.1 WhiB family transcriptional regulator [Acidimicrobiales bacterium]
MIWGIPLPLTAEVYLTTIDWRTDAACRDTDPSLFFPIGTTGNAIEQIADAKQVCFECVRRDDCLEFALSTNQDTGVWGGASEEERRIIRRRRRAERQRAS